MPEESSEEWMRLKLSAEVIKGDLVERVAELSGQSLSACYQC